MVNPAYYGHETQLFDVEEHRLVGGKGDGMRLFEVKNGLGLQFTVSADRAADISRLSYGGTNYGFFSANGYVAPQYYDDKGAGWLKNFTAGFLTTCGLTAVGSPCCDEGTELPLHGGVANIPAEHIYWESDEKAIRIHATVRHSGIFAEKLMLYRTIECSLVKNELTLTDRIVNNGDTESPLMVLYHMNMGYPLLSETAQLKIPSENVTPRNNHAAEDIDTWNVMLPPQPCFEEQCYYHSFPKNGLAAIYNPAIDKGLAIRFDATSLDHFVEWKMMGVKDYVLGLEPGNCSPDGRDVMRKSGKLKFIAPGEEKVYSVRLQIVENKAQWDEIQ